MIVLTLVLKAIGSQAIIYSSTELVSVNPPDGLTCGIYMDPFMEFAGGYLTNPGVAEGCQYCPFTFFQSNDSLQDTPNKLFVSISI
jgi:ATP-binding cassette subfamily G (WHITE) protein 2 (SNQ2)